jgi:hypothetical protein
MTETPRHSPLVWAAAVIVPQVATLALADALYLAARGFDVLFAGVHIAWICMTFIWTVVSAVFLRDGGPGEADAAPETRRLEPPAAGDAVVRIGDWLSRRRTPR